ncbi:hypothetical protein [Deinococcus sp. QL22]|uniref:hypothetical protein n=1 Tax=Deinococcus sp. QL22 TaxID=2939437 RepID=UPI0020175530|nr:hypothetical protein [Deinococcus sp. QL22]UQN06360.1 hypothetical protein M1R55_00080 [Deinococcus sp. QL22]
MAEFDTASLAETLAGRIVLSIGSHRTPDAEALAHVTEKERVETLARLAALHRHKIDLADEILVISTWVDIWAKALAQKLGTPSTGASGCGIWKQHKKDAESLGLRVFAVGMDFTTAGTSRPA